jgi:hypothetical protein
MKTSIIFLMVSWLCLGSIQACNSCGCAPGGSLLGLGNYENGHYIGLRYLQRGFETRLPNSLFGNPEVKYHKAQFQIVELDYWYYLHKRWRLQATLPYRNIHSTDPYTALHTQGLADAQFQAWYMVLPAYKTDKGFTYSLLAGAGSEMPTGKFDQTNQAEIPFSMQPGSKSWDWLGQYYFQIGKNKWQISQQSAYRRSGFSPNRYRFSDVFNTRIAFHYRFYTMADTKVIAALGLNREYYLGNYNQGKTETNSEGGLSIADIGVMVVKNRLSFEASFFMPFAQNVGGGNVRSTEWIQTKIAYQLKTN